MLLSEERKPQQAMVPDCPDARDLSDLTRAAAWGDEGDRAILAGREEAAIFKPAEVGEVALSDRRIPAPQILRLVAHVHHFEH